MQLQTVIEQLGYPPNQAKIYLASLRTGEATVTEIAVKVRIPRTTVSQVLELMQRRGLMHSYTKHNKRYWVAENPDKLELILKEREEAFQSILPNLHTLQKNARGEAPAIEVLTGVEQIQQIMEDIITTKHHIRSMVSWDDFIEYMGMQYIEDYIERRVAHSLQMRLITVRSDTSAKLKALDAKQMRHTRYLPNQIELRRVSNFIYGDKVAMISFNRKKPTGILLEDRDVVHAMDIYFESLWLQCSDN
jgi:sugar-specific transcriptional regulator TrmB